jgi:exopolysaccharide biosynthesis WecB/TagA/CpsF family protein
MMDRAVNTVALFMYDLSGGGVERMRLRLAGGLAGRGYVVTLIVQRLSGVLLDSVPVGVNVIALNRAGGVGSTVALARVLRSVQPDVLITSLDHCNIAALCASVLGGGRTRIFVCQHNALSAEQVLGWKYRAVPVLYRLLAPLAAGFVAVSNGVANDLCATSGISRARVAVISNPVTDGERGGAPDVPKPHAWFDGPEPVFLFAGRLVPQKDPFTLLDAFARRLLAGAAKLIVLGEGPLLPELRARARELNIADRVEFAGFQAHPLPWIRHAHALVLSSRYEGFGNVIVDALHCGTPVVATDCPYGPAEILDNGIYGRLVPVGDADAMARAMQSDLRGDFASHVLRARAAEFSLAACLQQHEALFDRIIARPARRAFGLRFSRLKTSSVADLIVREDRTQVRLVVTPNIDHVRLLQRKRFAAAYDAAALVCADGFPVALYAWLKSAAPLRRVTGCDILHDLVRHPALASRRVMVVAESWATQVALHDWLIPRGLSDSWRIAVAPLALGDDASAEADLVAAISAFAPDILVMTLGAPVSEEFVYRHLTALPPCWALCFGQAVRVEIGLVGRAPRLLRMLGLEWFWRVLREPRRLIPRYVRAALWFPRAVAADLALPRR